MAEILNKKEEVIKLELTKHGRKKLGLGRFKPSYYSFYDDSVLYDTSYYTNTQEETNFIQDRILNESLTFSSLNLSIENKKYEIGNSSVLSDYAPSWSIKALNGKLQYLNEQSDYYTKKFNIDTLNCHIEFYDQEKNYENIKINSEYVLIDLDELNVGEDISNFNIELLYYDDLQNKKTYKKLLFVAKKSNIIDEYIYDEDELPTIFNDIDIDENYASYFYDILVDEEIDTDYIVNAGRGVTESINGILNRVNNSSLPSISSLGIDGSIISVSPNGDVITVDEESPKKQYEGSLCRLLCCP